MVQVIGYVKKFLPMFLVSIAHNLEEIGLVTFDDHYPKGYERPNDNPLLNYGMSSNLEEVISWITEIPIGDGNDFQESIGCALELARSMDPDAHIWLLTDAVGHGDMPLPGWARDSARWTRCPARPPTMAIPATSAARRPATLAPTA